MNADARRRAYLGISRGTLVSVNDSPMMQELTIRDRFGDQKTNVEHWHPYGFTSVPKAPEGGKEAEVLVAYLGGNPDHPVVVGTADRRHRPKDLKPGESAYHDDQGQMLKIGRDGIELIAGSGNRPISVKVGGVTFKIGPDGVDITGGYIKHNGKKIDATHKHGGVQAGGSKTDVPDG